MKGCVGVCWSKLNEILNSCFLQCGKTLLPTTEIVWDITDTVRARNCGRGLGGGDWEGKHGTGGGQGIFYGVVHLLKFVFFG